MGSGKAGFFAGGTVAPDGIGVGVYFDSNGNFYPQGYVGTPGISGSAGYSTDVPSLLTGKGASVGSGGLQYTTGLPPGTSGFGVGTPGAGLSYGVDGTQALKQGASDIQTDATVGSYHYDQNQNPATEDPQTLADYDEMNGTHELDDYNRQVYGMPDDSTPPSTTPSTAKNKSKDKLKWSPMLGCPTCPAKASDYPRYPGYKARDGSVTKGSPYWIVK